MSIVGGIAMMEGAFSSLLSTTDHQRVRSIIVSCSFVISATVAFLLVPKFGLVGALASHATSRLLVFSIYYISIVKLMKVKMPFTDLMRITLTGLIAVAAVAPILLFSTAPAYEFAAGIVFGLVFVVCSFLTKVWMKKDISVLNNVAKRVPKLAPVIGWMESRVRD